MIYKEKLEKSEEKEYAEDFDQCSSIDSEELTKELACNIREIAKDERINSG